MKKLFFLFFLISVTTLAQKSKEVSISPFNGVKVYSGIHVKLIPSDTNKMVIFGDNIETVVFTLKKDVLKIRHSIDQLLNPSTTYVELYFTEDLDALHTYQGSTLESTAEINTTSIILKAHEGSRQTLNITSEKIDSRVKSGGFLNISGKATSHRLSILGGGICEGEKLLTEQTTVKVTAGGVAYLYASELLEATVSVGGIVRIHGKPTKLIRKKVIGGTIVEMN
ncbi:MAG: DUF2807 domain-containing protein [Flavobacteriaceae bacterium]|nr:DUF2807 domain-containing protein [Flavobacteriaceae bacterium]